MTAPTWLGASAGYTALSGQVNQNLLTHNSVWSYSGSLVTTSAVTGTAVYTSTDALYLAQTFTTGASQTGIGQVWLQLSAVGGSPITATITPLVVSLYLAQFGLPTGSPIASATVVEQDVYTGPFWLSVPLVASVSPTTSYYLVVSPAGTATAYYVWQQSNRPSGALTAPDGTTWTSQSFGYMYQIFDNSGTTGPLTSMVDDDGARYLQLTYTSGQLTGTTEYVQTQNGVGLTQTRTFTYSGNQLIGVN
jgi:hypothetical protein